VQLYVKNHFLIYNCWEKTENKKALRWKPGGFF